MKSRTLTVAVVALAGIASGAVLVKSVSFSGTTNAGYSSAASSATASPAPQASGEYVFACVNKSGKIDYLEFRAPLRAPVLVRRRDAVAFRGPARGDPDAETDPYAHSHSYSRRLGPGRVRFIGVPVIVCVRIGIFVIVIHGDQPTGQLTGVRPC